MNILLAIISIFNLFYNKPILSNELFDSQIQISINNIIKEKKEYQVYLKKNYFNGESKKTIAKKLNKYLNSSLKNKGDFIVEYSLKVGMDPYLATAVMLQETGCYWNCSTLTKKCNNVGGNKGTPSCNGGSYKRFSTLNDGIKFSIDKLNYYYNKKGLKTAKQINKYYAADKTWYVKVNRYIKKLKG